MALFGTYFCLLFLAVGVEYDIREKKKRNEELLSSTADNVATSLRKGYKL